MIRELGDLDDIRYVYDQAGCQIREQHYHPGDEAPYIDLEASCGAGGPCSCFLAASPH
jgi:hypothetical protein